MSSAAHDDGIPLLAPGTATTPPEHLPASYYTRFLSKSARSYRPNPIRGLFHLEKPGIISMLAGKPNPDVFPLTGLTLTAREPGAPADAPLSTLPIEASHVADGLQYGQVAGWQPFLDWLDELQRQEHGRSPGEGWRLTCGLGSNDLIYKAICAIVDPGESVLVESPTFAGTITIFAQHGCDLVSIPIDAEGIIAEELRSTLQKWPERKPKPKVLYTVAYGCNPSGVTTSESRRREILQLAEEHDFLILEDDPYYYLYYGTAPRPASYFKLEPEVLSVPGRVVRFDSFSKILSAGLRIGFASGPKLIIDAMDMHTATSNLQPPGMTQVIAYTLLKHWGYDGFVAHTRYVADFYRAKRDIFVRALEMHLSGLVEWIVPEAGMFIWFKILLPPDNPHAGDSEALIREEAYSRGVLALPGTLFIPNNPKSPYVRAAFSLLEEADVNEGLRRLAETVRAASTFTRTTTVWEA